MKPGFALSLSFEGISLLQRAAGGWRSVGEISLESGDLADELTGLRDKAKLLGDGELRCKVIIPNDQIRYLSIDTGSFDGEAHLAMIRQALEGATPYPVNDLAYDISVDGIVTHIAAVARETLAEAEAFAVEHGFNPLSFVAVPADNPYLGEPYFGPTAHAATLPGATEVEPDGIAVVVIGPAKIPVAEPLPEPEPAPAGFSSRRKPAAPPKAAESPAPDSPAPVEFKSSKAAAGGDTGPASAAEDQPGPEPLVVTAPTLDVPEVTEAGAAEAEETEEQPAPSGLSAFLSRRRKPEPMPPVPAALPIPPAPAPIAEFDAESGAESGPESNPEPVLSAAPEITAISRPVGPAFAGAAAIPLPGDEAARMTVFGARGNADVGGKPRHLGLILAAALLLFLAGVAAWASIFLDDGVAGLFRPAPAKTEVAAVEGTPAIGTRTVTPATPQVGAADPVQPATDAGRDSAGPAPEEPVALALLPPPSGLDLPDLPAPRRLDQPAQSEQPDPATPELSDTDSAVLDALRRSEPQQEQTAASPDIAALAEPETGSEAGPETGPAAELAGQAPAGTVEEAATGLLQTAPQVPETPSIIGLDDLYIASIDRTDLSQDAVALPTVASLATDLPLGAVRSPVAAGTTFDLDPAGLVTATVEGTLNPDGVMVFLGRPAAVPPAIPARLAPDAETAAAAPDLVPRTRPRPRPADLEERFERNHLGGLTREELSGLRPRTRPASRQQEAEPDDAAPTAQAVVSSRIPRARPGNFAAIVSAAVRPAEPEAPRPAAGSQTERVAAAAPRAAAPRIPSSASVARQATLRNEINLRRVNLIGVYGTPSNRRALVRLPSGRYKKVKVGDSVDGGRVVAIGDSELRYQKSGRNLTLKIPSS